MKRVVLLIGTASNSWEIRFNANMAFLLRTDQVPGDLVH